MSLTPRDLRSSPREEPARETAPRRQRKNKGSNFQDAFYVSPDMIPEGSTYEWKRLEVYGKEDHEAQISYREQGWEPVQADSVPSLVMAGTKGRVVRQGMILMERPTYLTQEAQEEDRRRARFQVETKEAEIEGSPGGKVGKSIERMSVPD